MGTRNITQVILDGETKVSQYCQWDGYPEGQGATVLEFLKNMDRDLFEQKLRNNCTYPLNEEIKTLWADAFVVANRKFKIEKNVGLPKNEQLPDEEMEQALADDLEQYKKNGLVNFDVSEKLVSQIPTLARNIGADILQYIQDAADPVYLALDLDFVNDSLFCEWAYVVDLDNNVLEVYEGFNRTPVPADNRFQLDNDKARDTSDGDKYYPVRLVHTFPLDDLPDEKTFIKVCTPADEDEDEEEETQEEVFDGVVSILREMSHGGSIEDNMVSHMLNYLDANKDDFFEAINNT